MFRIQFDTENEAFYDQPREEIARILADVTAKVRAGKLEGKILDENGNTIGEWKWS